MKKVAIYSVVIFMLILCTFGAGCVSTDGNGISIPGAIDSDAQKEFDEWMKLVENPSNKYIVHTGELRLYRLSTPDVNLFRITYMSETNKVLAVYPQLASSKLSPIANGAKLDDSLFYNVFIIKDSAVSTNTVTALENKETGVTDFAVLHLTAKEYDAFVKYINDWFKEHHS